MAKSEPSDLVGAGVPADQGLSSLGMLMQLGGTLFAALMTVLALTQVMAVSLRSASGSSSGDPLLLWVLLAMFLSIGRSLFQRSAGAALLYGTRDSMGNATESPLRPLHRYIVAALIQSALVGALLVWKLDASVRIALGTSFGLAAWPLALAGMMSTGRFRRFGQEIPVSEDKGFEGASILMTIFGLCGAVSMGAILAYFLNAGADALEGVNALLVITVGVLFVRSCLHAHAGINGLKTTSIDRAVELANRYANFGVISAFVGGAAVLIFSMSISFTFFGILPICAVVWMLMSWPLIVRRFYSDRQFADLLAGPGAVHRRSPDAGMTSLGWFLLASSMIGMFGVATTLLGTSDAVEKMNLLIIPSEHSPWWNVGIVCLEGWAGFELIRMSNVHRKVANLYGIIGTAITIWVSWPQLKDLSHYHFGATNFLGPALLALSLIVPVVTLILANRQISPQARARFRDRSSRVAAAGDGAATEPAPAPAT